jgi:hypothetical protein
MNNKDIKISSSLQLEIFEEIFLYMLDYVLMREKLKAMLESRDRVDEAELDLKLRKLELELLQNQKGEDI